MSKGGFGYGRFGGNPLDLVFGIRIELFTYCGKMHTNLVFSMPRRLAISVLVLSHRRFWLTEQTWAHPEPTTLVGLPSVESRPDCLNLKIPYLSYTKESLKKMRR